MTLGLPLCRDPEWLSLMINFTQNWLIGAQILRPLPDWLKRSFHWPSLPLVSLKYGHWQHGRNVFQRGARQDPSWEGAPHTHH